MLLSVPPFAIVSAPMAELPTVNWAVAPAVPPDITVGLGVTVSMFAFVAPVGTPALQLPGVNQSEVAPIQLVVCAHADVAMSNAAATAVAISKCVRISPPLAPGACRDCRFREAPRAISYCGRNANLLRL